MERPLAILLVIATGPWEDSPREHGNQVKIETAFQSSAYAAWHSTLSYLLRIVAQHSPSSLWCIKPLSRPPFNLTSVYPVPALHMLPPSAPFYIAVRYSSFPAACPNHLSTRYSWSTLLSRWIKIMYYANKNNIRV